MRSVIIENVSPELDDGRYPIKRELGDTIQVRADIFADGHDVMAAILRYRNKGVRTWSEIPMQLQDNHRWTASFTPGEIGRCQYTIQAYKDVFRTWLQELQKKHEAGQDVSSELLEGEQLIENAGKRAPKADSPRFVKFLQTTRRTRWRWLGRPHSSI